MDRDCHPATPHADGRRRRRLSYANVVATLALIVAIGTGSAYAASKIGASDIKDGAIRARHIKKGQVDKRHLVRDAVRAGKIRNGAVKAKELAPILEAATTTEPIGAGTLVSFVTDCPAGTKLISGGYSAPAIPFDPTGWEINASFRDGNAWRVEGQHDLDAPSSLTVFAYCLART